MLIDVGGADRYAFTCPIAAPGTAVFDARFLDRQGPPRYWTEPISVGLFLDVGGEDDYPAGFGDGRRRHRPAAATTPGHATSASPSTAPTAASTSIAREPR